MRPWPKSPFYLIQIGAVLIIGAALFWTFGGSYPKALVASGLGLLCLVAGLVASAWDKG